MEDEILKKAVMHELWEIGVQIRCEVDDEKKKKLLARKRELVKKLKELSLKIEMRKRGI